MNNIFVRNDCPLKHQQSVGEAGSILRMSQVPPTHLKSPARRILCRLQLLSYMTFLLQEAILEAFVAFLDVRKAFDTVWHEGLLVKLLNNGIKGHLWHLINTWYTTSSGCVLWNGQRSDPLPGGVLSLYSLYCIVCM